MATTKELPRDSFWGYLKPFWNHKPKVAEQPNRIVLKPDQLSRHAHDYLLASGEYLTPMDTREYNGLLPAGGPDSWHDFIALAMGTPSLLLAQMHDFIAYQNPDGNNTALLLGGTCTPGDAEPLASRERLHAYWVRMSEQYGTGWRYVDNPPSHRIISSLIGNIASTGGNGGDQRRALHNLLTDAFTAPDILALVKQGCRAFLDYYPNGCALFTAQGGGGTDPYLRYALALLKSKLKVNRHYKLYLLPTDDEPLHQPNLRGSLAFDLEREAADKTPTLHFLHKQQTVGAHKSDRALVSGIITLASHSKGRLNGGIDPTNVFELIRKTAGTWLLVTPIVVELPMVPLGKVEMIKGRRHEEHYKVNMSEEKGGKRVNPIVAAIEDLVLVDLAAHHFVTISAYLNKEEMDYIAQCVRRFDLAPGGRLHLYFNPSNMHFNADKDTAEALLCDFRGGSGVTECLDSFLLNNKTSHLLPGLPQPHQLALYSALPERALTAEIEEQLQRILKFDHLY
jgi:hypothetical protein